MHILCMYLQIHTFDKYSIYTCILHVRITNTCKYMYEGKYIYIYLYCIYAFTCKYVCMYVSIGINSYVCM